MVRGVTRAFLARLSDDRNRLVANCRFLVAKSGYHGAEVVIRLHNRWSGELIGGQLAELGARRFLVSSRRAAMLRTEHSS